jgi:hypothetical protein
LIVLKFNSFVPFALAGCMVVTGLMPANAQDAPVAPQDGWVSLFDGKSLDGWKSSENKDSFRVEDGAIVVDGPRAHLFYVADEKPFVDFEFKAEVMTMPNSNSGIFIHTQFQDAGWLRVGYECQVNQTHGDPIKTGSLYNVVDVFKVPLKEGETFSPNVTVHKNRVLLNVPEAPAKDNEWFTYRIVVKGKRILTQVNGKTLVDYTEPDNKQPGADFTRVLDKGTFALQAHDPKSKVLFRNIQVKRLP